MSYLRPPKPPGSSSFSGDDSGADVADVAEPVKKSAKRPKRAAKAARRGGLWRGIKEWLQASRLTVFTAMMATLVILGALVLVPTVGTYVEQQRQIALLKEQIAVSEAELAQLEADRDRWSDPVYITTQARERLYFVHPGELVFLISNDLDMDRLREVDVQLSSEISHTETDWSTQLLRSLVTVGTSGTVTAFD